MPGPDPAFSWLLEHDPDSIGASRRQYAAAVGILSPQDELDCADRHLMEEVAPAHCSCCRQKAHVAGRTVE